MTKEIGKEKNGQSLFQMDIVVATLKKNLSVLVKRQLNGQTNICPTMQKPMPMLHLVGMKNTPKKNLMNILKIVVMRLKKVRKKMMINFIKKYKWCKRMGIRHPIKATLDKNFLKGRF